MPMTRRQSGVTDTSVIWLPRVYRRLATGGTRRRRDAEDRGREAHAKGQRQDSGDEKPALPHERSEREPQIVQHRASNKVRRAYRLNWRRRDEFPRSRGLPAPALGGPLEGQLVDLQLQVVVYAPGDDVLSV